jgi:rSAM/selenodomain-associated transferase 2
MRIDVVIPVLDEIDELPGTVARLRALEPPPAAVIVADGGSTDGTREWLAANADGWLVVVDAPRGRGEQMNAGAAAATGDALVFLHADAAPPGDALAEVERALADRGTLGGAFAIRFAPRAGAPRSMPIVAWGINARTWVTRTATGDQAIFVRRDVFERLGGYRPWPLFEDVDLVTRIKTEGRFRILRGPVEISDRRYATFGPWRTTLLMWRLRARYLRGASPMELKRAFVDVRREDGGKSGSGRA